MNITKHMIISPKPVQTETFSETNNIDLQITKPHIIRLTETIVNHTNNKQTCCALKGDIKKLFDKLWHHGLSYKMNLLEKGQEISKIKNKFIISKTVQKREGNELSDTMCTVFNFI